MGCKPTTSPPTMATKREKMKVERQEIKLNHHKANTNNHNNSLQICTKNTQTYKTPKCK